MSEFSEILHSSRHIFGSYHKFELLLPFFAHYEKMIATDCSLRYYRENFVSCLTYIEKLKDILEGVLQPESIKHLLFILLLCLRLVALYFSNVINRATDENELRVMSILNKQYAQAISERSYMETNWFVQIQSHSFSLESIRSSLTTSLQMLKSTCMRCASTLYQMLPIQNQEEKIDCDMCRKQRATILTLVEIGPWLRKTWMNNFDCHFIFFHCSSCTNMFAQCKKCEGMMFDQLPGMPACTCPMQQKEPRSWLEFLEEMHDPELQRAKAESRRMSTTDKELAQLGVSMGVDQPWQNQVDRRVKEMTLNDEDEDDEEEFTLQQNRPMQTTTTTTTTATTTSGTRQEQLKGKEHRQDMYDGSDEDD